MTSTFLDEAARLLGPKGLTTAPDDIAPWLTDWRGRYTGKALALASPASTDEVAALVALCARRGRRLTSLAGAKARMLSVVGCCMKFDVAWQRCARGARRLAVHAGGFDRVEKTAICRRIAHAHQAPARVIFDGRLFCHATKVLVVG